MALSQNGTISNEWQVGGRWDLHKSDRFYEDSSSFVRTQGICSIIWHIACEACAKTQIKIKNQKMEKKLKIQSKSGNTLNYPTHCVPARRQNTEEKLIERGWVGSGAGQTSHFDPFLRLVVNISWCPKRPKKMWCDFVNELLWDKEKTS